jgi:hypothetical protein
MQRFYLSAIIILVQLFAPSLSASDKATDAKIVSQTGLFYKPNDVEPGVHTLNFGDHVVFRRTLWGLSAQIDKDVVIRTGKGSQTIPAGSVLPAMMVSGVEGINSDQTIFCTDRKKIKVDDGWNISRLISESRNDDRKCLVDQNSDGIADAAFMFNSGDTDGRNPQQIDQISLNIEKFREAGKQYFVSIALWSTKKPEFYIAIVHNDKGINFDTITSNGKLYKKFYKAPKNYKLPHSVDIFGAKFDIISFDRERKKMSIEFDKKQRDLLISVPTQIFSQYRY